MTKRGRVVKYVEERGFGFLRCEEADVAQEIFFHVKDVIDRRDLKVGAKVTFSLGQGDRGLFGFHIVPDDLQSATTPTWQPRAIVQPARQVQEFNFAQAAAGAVAICMSAIFFFIDVPIFLKYLSAIQIATYFTYCEDKRRAIYGIWRIREARLHFLALIGGTPAALLAQEVLRHKTKKESFRQTQRRVFRAQLLVVAGCLIWYFAFPDADLGLILDNVKSPIHPAQ